MRGLPVVALALAWLLSSCSFPLRTARQELVLGAVYPLTGPQGDGGREELAGVKTAVDILNRQGGVQDRQVRLVVKDAPTAAAGVAAVDELVAKERVPAILGSYSSVVAVAASAEASRLRTIWWETGAVADDVTMPPSGQAPPYVFRTVATGSNLGRTSAQFTSEVLLPHWGIAPHEARVVLLYEGDVYGRSVAAGARDEAKRRGITHVVEIPYDAGHVDPQAIAREVREQRPDFLWDSSYLADGIALWRAIAGSGVQLKGAIGTSSAFCMPEFGAALGPEATGLFASDKPDGTINDAALSADAKATLKLAEETYSKAERKQIGISGLAGFVGAWALLHDVAPSAKALTPDGLRDAAMAVDMPAGAEVNGAGLRFGPPGSPDAGQNQRAAGVVWQWQDGAEKVVFPAGYETAPPRLIQVPVAR